MNKITFMNDLQTNLHNVFSKKQSEDILADYDEFFTSGLAEGKSEEELCEQFGTPKQIITNLLDNAYFTEPKAIGRRIFKDVLIVFTLFMSSIFGSAVFYPQRHGNLSIALNLLYCILPLLIVGVGNTIEKASHSNKLLFFRQKYLAETWLYVFLFISCLLFSFSINIRPYSISLVFAMVGALLLFVLCFFLGYYPAKESKPVTKKNMLIFVYSFCFVSILFGVYNLYKIYDIHLNNKFEEFRIFYQVEIYLFQIVLALLFFTGILIMYDAIHHHSKLKWFLFLNVFLYQVMLQLIDFLCNIDLEIGNPYLIYGPFNEHILSIFLIDLFVLAIYFCIDRIYSKKLSWKSRPTLRRA